jgi:hypothetical protein
VISCCDCSIAAHLARFGHKAQTNALLYAPAPGASVLERVMHANGGPLRPRRRTHHLYGHQVSRGLTDASRGLRTRELPPGGARQFGWRATSVATIADVFHEVEARRAQVGNGAGRELEQAWWPP